MERTIKTLTLILSADDYSVKATMYDPNDGNSANVEAPYFPDEHPEFDELIGNAIYKYFIEFLGEWEGDDE